MQRATLFAYALILSGIVSLFASSNLGGWWFVLIGIYILVAARTTYEQLGPENSVLLDVEADELLDRIAKTGRCKFLVADRGQLAGVISLTDLVSVIAVMSQIGVP